MSENSTPSPRKRRRIFWWFFIAIQVVFVVWIIAGAHSGSHPSNCGNLDPASCQSAADVGTTIGVGIVLMLQVIVSILLLVGYLLYRITRRDSRV